MFCIFHNENDLTRLLCKLFFLSYIWGIPHKSEPTGAVERKYRIVPVCSVCFDKRRYGGTPDEFDIRFRAHHERCKRNLQPIRYLPEYRDGWVGHAAFDLSEHAFAYAGAFRYGLKAEFPLFPQALEVFRYNQADIFQGRYPVRI